VCFILSNGRPLPLFTLTIQPTQRCHQAESLAFPLTADFPEISRESVNHAGCPLGIPVSSDSPLVHLRSVKAVDELSAAMDALAAAAAAAAVVAATIPRALDVMFSRNINLLLYVTQSLAHAPPIGDAIVEGLVFMTSG